MSALSVALAVLCLHGVPREAELDPGLRSPLPFRVVLAEEEERKDAWLGADKFKHFLVSALLTGFGYVTLREPLDASEEASVFGGGGFALGVGLGKEVYDWKSRKGQPSYKDLVADLLGIGFAIFLFRIT